VHMALAMAAADMALAAHTVLAVTEADRTPAVTAADLALAASPQAWWTEWSSVVSVVVRRLRQPRLTWVRPTASG
jgi:hypothetical protein